METGLAQAGPNFTVTTTNEHNDGTCLTDDCTLIEAVDASNANADASIINFAPGLAGTITNTLVTFGFAIRTPLTINGPGARSVTLSGNNAHRLFNIYPGAGGVRISGLTLSNGVASGSYPDNVGGAIINADSLTVTECAFNSSSATDGGAIYNNGVSGNASMTLVNCTLFSNSAQVGGAIMNEGNGGHATLNLTSCTLFGNSAAYGGAIYNNGSVSGNAALTLTNCTFDGNVGTSIAGGIYNDALNPNSSGIATVIVRNTLMRTGSSGVNLYNESAGGGTITSQGNNLSTDDGGGFLSRPSDSTNITNPSMDFSLKNNGGPTDTVALLGTSSAINGGNDAYAPPTDQRGYVRVGVSDIGAFEYFATPPVLKILSITRLGNGHILLGCMGVPNTVNDLQAASNLSSESFVTISPAPPGANASGAFQYDDAAAVGLTRRFYRLTFP